MKIEKKSQYNFLSNFVLRTPFDSTDLTPVNHQRLVDFAQKNKEALYFSSYALFQQIFTHPDTERLLASNEKLCFSLLKYHQRSKFRCTPFGLFAASGTGKWDIENKAPKTPFYTRRTALDMHYSVVLAQYLASLKFIRSHLLFYPNSSIYISGSKLRYVEYIDKKDNREFQLSEVDHSIYLDKILKLSQSGAIPSDLAQCVVDEQISFEDAESFIIELVNAQILVSELEPVVTGNELTCQITKCLKRIQESFPNPELRQILDGLSTILEKLGQMDQRMSNPIENYDEVISLIHQLNIPYDIDKLFQVDLFLDTIGSRSNEYCLDEKIQRKLINVFDVLSHFPITNGVSHLTKFKEAFTDRYEDRFVPLLKAMDNESGIGYGFNINHSGDVNPLIDKLSFEGLKLENISFSDKDIFLFDKLKKANETGEYTIQITLEEVQSFPKNRTNLPDSMFAFFSVLNKGEEGKSKIHLKGFFGPSAVNVLGRFAYGHPGIFDIVKGVADCEEKINSGKILAEICHLPENRTGNILLRPHLRTFEIPYLALSDLPKENQLELSDLHIGVIHGRFVLWSKKNDKEVLPRMANAHDFRHNSLPAYHFLCDLQSQNIRESLFFDWRGVANIYQFLPRVEIQGVIVQPATWILKKRDYADLTIDLFNERPEKIVEWKRKWNLPDKFYLTEYDNELLIHFHESSPLLIKLFLSEIQKKSSVVLKEFLFDMDNPLIRHDEDKSRTNEFIAPLIKNELKIESYRRVNLQSHKVQEQFAPGSEWLYYNIYCGVKSADFLLTEKIRPLTLFMLEQKLIDYWFFIRYEDPNPHLRVRLHLHDKSNIGRIMDIMHETLETELSNGIIWKLQLDTYKRELNRYMEHSIEHSETLFNNDSNYVSEMIAWLNGDGKDEKRWLFALVSVDKLLDDFQISFDQKITILDFLTASFQQEFNITKETKIEIDKRYRSKKTIIESVFEYPNDEFIELYKILEKRTKSNLLVSKEILNKIKANHKSVLIENVVASFTHMHLNRVFRSEQRKNEMMVYNFLNRYLRSRKARGAKSSIK